MNYNYIHVKIERGKSIYLIKEELAKIEKIKYNNLSIKTIHFKLKYIYNKISTDLYELKKWNKVIDIHIPLILRYKNKILIKKNINIGKIPIPNNNGEFIINGNKRIIDMN